MQVVLFGATGMVGQGVLRACLADQDVDRVLVVGRQVTGFKDVRLREILHADFSDFSAIKNEFRGMDACFYCLGISSLGMNEADYRRITYDMTLAAAKALLEASPTLTFEYISGQGTGGSSMWARVKGETENALLQMPFKAAYMFRPGIIIPLDGVKSKTFVYSLMYGILSPILPLLKRLAPGMVTDTRRLSQAMLRVAKSGASKQVLEMNDISMI